MGRGEGGMLTEEVGKNVNMLHNPRLRGFDLAGAVWLRFTALAEEAGTGTARGGAAGAVPPYAGGATGERAQCRVWSTR